MAVLNQIRVNKSADCIQNIVQFFQCPYPLVRQECPKSRGIPFWSTVDYQDIFVLELLVCQAVYNLHFWKCADQAQICRI